MSELSELYKAMSLVSQQRRARTGRTAILDSRKCNKGGINDKIRNRGAEIIGSC